MDHITIVWANGLIAPSGSYSLTTTKDYSPVNFFLSVHYRQIPEKNHTSSSLSRLMTRRARFLEILGWVVAPSVSDVVTTTSFQRTNWFFTLKSKSKTHPLWCLTLLCVKGLASRSCAEHALSFIEAYADIQIPVCNNSHLSKRLVDVRKFSHQEALRVLHSSVKNHIKVPRDISCASIFLFLFFKL